MPGLISKGIQETQILLWWCAHSYSTSNNMFLFLLLSELTWIPKSYFWNSKCRLMWRLFGGHVKPSNDAFEASCSSCQACCWISIQILSIESSSFFFVFLFNAKVTCHRLSITTELQATWHQVWNSLKCYFGCIELGHRDLYFTCVFAWLLL